MKVLCTKITEFSGIIISKNTLNFHKELFSENTDTRERRLEDF